MVACCLELLPQASKNGVSKQLITDISPGQIVELQRMRVIDAMTGVVAERGFANASVAGVVERAGVSRTSFYELFDGLEDCFLAVLRSVMGRSTSLILEAFEEEDCWLDGVCAGLTALLRFLDAEPQSARVCVVETLAAGPRALEHRQRELAVLAPLIDAGRQQASSGCRPPALAVEGVIASVIGVLHTRLVNGEAPPFIALLAPLTGLVLLPYLDAAALTAQVERAEVLSTELASQPLPEPNHAWEIPDALKDPLAHRARQCVLYVARYPGASNRQIALGIGINHQGQISTLLGRLSRMGLLVGQHHGPGRANAWRLTPHGERVSGALGRLAD